MHNIHIVGAGLAGTTLAWALHLRGCQVSVEDHHRPSSSSRIAAGLMTPITGKRLNESWRWQEFRPVAERFYTHIEAVTGERFFHAKSIVRLFTSSEEASRLTRPSDLVSKHEPQFTDKCIRHPHGAFEMPTAAQLDVLRYLNASQLYFKKHLTSTSLSSVTVLCEGYPPSQHSVFGQVPFRPAKGEILTVEIPDLLETRVLNRGGFWLAPLPEPHVYRFGATYSWHELDSIPTTAARAELEVQLQLMVTCPYRIVAQQAAVRPIAMGHKPRLGLHPDQPQFGYFNGLGSKGALLAPFYAEQLAAYFCSEGEIEPDVDVQKLLT